MIYDQTIGALYADDGTFIKTINCPLALRPDQLLPIEGNDRSCSACNKSIRAIDEMTDEDMAAEVAKNDALCVFFTAKAKNIVFLQPWGSVERNFQNLPTIQTLRSLEAMAAAHANGFILLIKNVGVSHPFGDRKFIVYQNVSTGELWWSGDYRQASPQCVSAEPNTNRQDGNWRLVRDWFYARSDKPFPLAAYAIPPTVSSGTRVFLPDVIEDHRYEVWNQGDSIRIVAAPAKWNGTDLEIEQPLSPCGVG